MQILANSAIFSQAFDRITQRIFKGFDWSNIIVAGDMVLCALLHTDPANDDADDIRNVFLNLYIHGLDRNAANQKIEQIYSTWNDNLPDSAEKILVKTARTLTYRPSHPHPVIQIRLKLYQNPTDVLMGLDLDPCAVAYDGSSVFMLPRCARAIETGYMVYTNDLIYGHRLSESGRLPARPVRLFKYASRGFGLRIQPSFAKFLQADQCTDREAVSWYGGLHEEEVRVTRQRDRYPFGTVEPGILTLKRVAYLGQDYVHRLHWGPTPLSVLSPNNAHTVGVSWRSAQEKVCGFHRSQVSIV